ncbi:MAG TPA: SRPBCC domain-containing protein [Polyangiaceae bacterium]|nr:SRPBCC domain-containing protein [Polyangiaceae bacterium]
MPTTPPKNLTVTRVFHVPAALVYAAWTDPKAVERWWGPNGFTCPLADMDVRVGGTSLVCMRAPAEWGGVELFNTWTYGLVEPGRRLEFVLRFADKDRRPIAPETLGIPPGVPPEVPHILTFVDLGDGRSEMTITEVGYTSTEALETSKEGLVQALDKLAGALST